MQCPYCRKRTGDMPNHLKSSKWCQERQRDGLRESANYLLMVYRKRRVKALGLATEDEILKLMQHIASLERKLDDSPFVWH